MVTKVLKIVADVHDEAPEDKGTIPLISIVNACNKPPEDRVLNPLSVVVDAYDNAPEEDRHRIRVILVMGLTGTGKSTFIKKLTDDHNVAIGEDLHSQTADVSLSKIAFVASNSQPYDVYLVDTPGFDDSTRSDTDVLRNIVHWLGAMRERRIKLSGIIYLHRITDNRMGGLAWRNLRMLHNLVGADKMSNVLLVSTRWEEQSPAESTEWRAMMETRQKQLEQGYVDHSGNPQQGFWQIYIQNGARVMRHDNSIYSAMRIVDNILIHSAPIYIQIQDEVHASKDLSQTAAGQAIKTDFEKAAEKAKEELTSAKVEMGNALKSAREARDRLRQQYETEISLMRQRMLAKSGEQRKLTNEELTNMEVEVEDTLNNARERRDRLRQQYEAEIALMQQRVFT